MPAYVRVRDTELLRRHIAAAGTQAEVARRVGLTQPRLSQLLTDTSPTILIATAARIEDVLDVTRGTLFRIDEPELVRDYLDPDDATELAPGDPDSDLNT